MKKIIEKIRKTILNTEFEDKTYLVGGIVRDSILGIIPNDIDIVVELPNGGIRLAEFLHSKNIASKPVVYKNFGTALSIIDSVNIEFVMTRKESYRAKNRKPSVQPATLFEDATRRDFTINAIYKKIVTEEILDITDKGLNDIKNKIIRTVTDADKVFIEDPLRMLRAIKYSVKLNFKIEDKTYNSIIKYASELNNISIERINEEFSYILTSHNPVQGIELLVKTGLMKHIIPELLELINLEQNKYHHLDVYKHTLKVLEGVSNDLALRLAALLHDIGKKRTFSKDNQGRIHFHKHEIIGAKMAEEILKRLKFPKSIIKEVSNLIRHHLRTKQFGKNAEIVTDKTLRRFILQTKNYLPKLLELIDADNKAHAPEYCMPNQIDNLKKRINLLEKNLNKMPVNGDDIKKYFNISQGKRVGQLLKKAEEIWIANPSITKEELLKLLP